jgi:hypothetical protein
MTRVANIVLLFRRADARGVERKKEKAPGREARDLSSPRVDDSLNQKW